MADTPKQIELTLSDGKNVTISLLPLKYYADLLKGITGTIKDIANDWDSISNEEIMAKLPEFIADHLDEAAMIVSVVTRGEISKKDVLEKYGLTDAIEIISAALQVNDIERMGATIKKAMAVFRKPKTGKHSLAQITKAKK